MNLSIYFFLFWLILTAACGTARTKVHHGYRLPMTCKPGDLLVAQELGGLGTDRLLVFSREDSRNDEWIPINIKEFGLGFGHQAGVSISPERSARCAENKIGLT